MDASFVLVLLASQDWPGWRGPRGDGASTERGLPVAWSRSEGVLWSVPVPGKGHSSPIIWGDRIFLTTAVEDKGERRLMAYDRRDGRALWDRLVLTAPLEKKHNLNSFASSTPLTDGSRIWVAFQEQHRFRVFCFDVEGNLLWQATPGEFHSVHGFSSSPTLYRDTVIFNGDQDAEAWIVALDRATGAVRWRADRPNRVRSYAPPVVFKAAGRDQLVLAGSVSVSSYDPATGRCLWTIDGPTEQYVASMVYADDVFFVTGGFPKLFLTGIRPDGDGNITGTHVLWQHADGASYVPSPVAWESRFFVVSDSGLASCLEAKTGRRLWKERLGKHHSASPVAADSRLYFTDDSGTTFVLKAGPEFELIAKNALGEDCRASPAISRGRMYFRTLGHLWSIGVE